MKIRQWLIIGLIVGMLAGCGLPGDGAPTAASAPSPQASPTAGSSPASPTPPSPGLSATADPTPTPAAGETQPASQPEPVPNDPPRPRYTLSAALNYDLHLLVVDEQIRYPNTSNETLTDLLLMVEPLYYPGVFQLNAMAWEDGAPVGETTREVSRLRIPLRQPLAPGASVTLLISYELRLPSPTPSAETRPVPFGYSARQANLVDWYPFVPPYVPGQGWLAHGAGYFGEHLAYPAADFEVSLHLGDRPNLQVAASAPAEVGADGWLRYRHLNARNFAWSVSDQYQIARSTVGEVEVLSYTFAFHEGAGQAALDATAKALALYNEIYGPYPHSLLSLVEADFLDGMEYDGLYFLSNGFYNLYQGQPGEYLVAIAAHETAHQWFYALVGSDQALEPWLDEALCTYSERLFYERYYPEALDWWWNYRVNYYNPQGAVNGSIYNPGGYRAYRDAVYLNGAVFLEELRGQVGDTAFFAFLKDYVSRSAHRIVTAQDFFTILGEHSQVDLSDLLGQFMP
jgi:hypothetical protein